MNAWILKWTRLFVLGLALAVLAGGVTGCASSQKKKIDWKARVGVFTHDDAVIEMGPPDKEARLSDGTVISQWLQQRGRSITMHQVLYGGWIRTDESPPGPDQFLTLTFSPAGLLADWKVVYK